MKVLIACEYSGTVRDAFDALGHYAVSCDFLPTETKGLHYQGNVLDILNDVDWDLMIAHPSCTYLTIAAEWAYAETPMINGKPRNIKEGTLIGAEREQARLEALAFVKRLWNAPIKKVCIENPVGVITKRLPEMGKPQYVQPHMFGHDASKNTGLWLRGLPPLTPTENIAPRITDDGKKRWANQTDSGQNNLPPTADRWKIRSTTYQGIADAMAKQWGNL